MKLTNYLKTVGILNSTKDTCRYTITSVSGGKTSAYMAVHYPTDYYIFSCVLTKDKNCKINDKGLLRDILNKIPQFEGSRELDLTLKNVLKLEQKLGKEVVWVHGKTFDEIIDDRTALPNSLMRFCTTEMKIKPIFEWCYMNLLDVELNNRTGKISAYYPCEMNIGFRYDEPKRVFKALNIKYDKHSKSYDFSNAGSCEKFSYSISCDLVGQYKNKNRTTDFNEWRIRQFPLFSEGVEQEEIISYWEKERWEFPKVSNCDFCFFHKQEEINYQYENNSERFNWWIDKEKELNRTFKNKTSYTDYLKVNCNIQEDIDDCNCTD